MKIKVYNQSGEISKEEEFSDKVFACKANQSLIHQVFVAQENNERQVLAHTKTKGEVSGGGKKPWKQKGTGRARAGSSRSPLWKGGGVTFGPRNDRNFSQKINKKMTKAAIMGLISDKVANNKLVILDEIKVADGKTKNFDKIITSIETKILNRDAKKERRKILFFTENNDTNTKRSGKNLAGVSLLNLENINVADLLKNKNVLITLDNARKLESQYNK